MRKKTFETMRKNTLSLHWSKHASTIRQVPTIIEATIGVPFVFEVGKGNEQKAYAFIMRVNVCVLTMKKSSKGLNIQIN